jgi:hypothetical protein
VASIRARQRADGTCAYTAESRIHEKKVVVYEEAKTFSRKASAEKWAPCPKGRTGRSRHPRPGAGRFHWEGKPFGSHQMVSRDLPEARQMGRNKEESLKRLERDPIGDEDALTLDGPRLVEFIKNRRLQGAGPSTAGNDLVWIGVVLRAAKNVDRKPVHPEIVDEAREACRELRLIGKSRRRYRRPTDSELAALDGHFELRDKRSDIPMLYIWNFALTSTRR